MCLTTHAHRTPTIESSPNTAAPRAPTLETPAWEPSGNPPAITAEDLHAIIQKAFCLGNRVRRRFIQGLLAMDESRLYLRFGCTSIVQYAERFFKSSHTQTYDMIRVARALVMLTQCDLAFKAGKISWSILRLITQVATSETEGEWLEFAAERTTKQVHAEVRDALKKKRARPREEQNGLPNLMERVYFELNSQEHNLLAKAIKKSTGEIARGLGEGAHVEPKDALLYLARRILETDLNTRRLVKEVTLRDGGICANPCCRRQLNLHSHHIEYRVYGGRTTLYNSVLVCKFCHSAVHLGYLSVEGDPLTGLRWKGMPQPSPLGFEAEEGELARSPEIRFELKPKFERIERPEPCGHASQSTRVDSGAAHQGLTEVLKAMMKIGFGREEGLQRLLQARTKLSTGPRKPSEEEILNEAIRN